MSRYQADRYPPETLGARILVRTRPGSDWELMVVCHPPHWPDDERVVAPTRWMRDDNYEADGTLFTIFDDPSTWEWKWETPIIEEDPDDISVG